MPGEEGRAADLFAAGHLGELTRIVPFEMVDAVLDENGAREHRLRKLPARVVVYLLLAAGLFEGIGYLGVWRKLVAGLPAARVPRVSGTALWHARTRLGPAPLKGLFDLLRGPASTACTSGARWRGLLVTAIDGTTMDVPDCEANRRWLGKHGSQHGEAGYPQLRLTALVACGTRAVIDAVFAPRSQGEPAQARRLLRSLHPGMIVLADRNFDGNALVGDLAATGAQVLVRLSGRRNPTVSVRYPDGSYSCVLGTTRVRVIEAQITIATRAGRRTGFYRLATTLLDHRRFPATDLVRLYHERWEVETAYFALKCSMLHRRVLRSRTPAGLAQEVYALLAVYQVLRIAITDATDTVPGTDPDRASFSIALEAARDQVVQAAGVIADTVIDLVGAIGRAVLDHPMPARRQRASPRAVKRPLSRYAYKSLKADRRSYPATIKINILHQPISP